MDPSSINRWSTKFLLDEAATLAMMREGPYDVRPALLLLFHAQDVHQLPSLLRFGYGYLLAWSDRQGIRVSREVLEHSALDALAVMWCRRAPEPIGARSRYFGIRNRIYSDLRNAALEIYQTRLHEARVRFIAGTTYTCATPPLKIRPPIRRQAATSLRIEAARPTNDAPAIRPVTNPAAQPNA